MQHLATNWASLGVLAGLLATVPLAAQDEPDAGTAAIVRSMTPGSQHTFLATYTGTWKVVLQVWSDPTQPPTVGTGTLERKMILGGRVLQDVVRAELLGRPFEGIGHIGYDNVTGKYWTTWFDDWSTSLTTLEGTADESKGEGTFSGTTSEPLSGKQVEMRLEIYEEDGKQISDSFMPIPGHGNMLTMKTIYERH